MQRLTHKRNNGIKSGYWSPEKKEVLVQRLAEYENTGLEPDQIRKIDQLYQELSREVMELRKRLKRISVQEQLSEREKPKRKRLLDIAMEQDDIDVSEIECPSEVRPEFQSYEKQCSSMSCVQCWGQEVDE